MITNNKEFALEVAGLVKELRKVDDVKKLLTAAAYLYAERNGPLYKFLAASDEAYEDARRLTTYISLKELGYED